MSAAPPDAGEPNVTGTRAARGHMSSPNLSRWTAERAYLVLALVFGGLFLAVTPPFQVPDEENHFRRAYEVSERRFFPVKRGEFTGDFLPRGIDDLWQRFSSLPQHREEKTSASEIAESAAIVYQTDDRQFAVFSNTAIHPQLTYLPQALAIFAARQFSPSVLVGFYAARVLNFATATLLTWLALRLTPVGKWAMSALALTPMALYESASLSSDALTNALAFLLVAQVLACALGPADRVSARALVALIASSAALALAKQAYFLLPLAYLLIPVQKMGSRVRYWCGFALVMAASLLPVVAWSFVVRDVYSPPDVRYAIDPAEQFRRMISRPAELFNLITGTAWRAPTYGEEYLGFLGWLDTRLPVWVYIVQALLLVFICLTDNSPPLAITTGQAITAACIGLLTVFAAFFVLHLTWDAIGAPYVGIQGRHLIPAGPLLAVALTRLGPGLFGAFATDLSRRGHVAFLLVSPVILSASLVQLWDRFYHDTDVTRAERLYQRGQALLKQPEKSEQAYALFDEALAADRGHPGAHYMVGLRLQDSDPRGAIEHFRAVLAREPNHLSTLTHLARVLADLGDYSEAIERCEQAVRLAPADASVKNQLNQTIRARDLLEHITRVFQPLAQSNLTSNAPHGQPDALYLKPMKGAVASATERVLPAPFVWRCPPPSGEPIRIVDNGESVSAGHNEPFFACSTIAPGGRRVFVFPPTVGARFFADQEISWYFQRPMRDLDEGQRARESAFRTARGLQFPLAKLPE